MNPMDQLHSGELYKPTDPDIAAEQAIWMAKVDAFNQLGVDQTEVRQALAREMFASYGEGAYIEPPLNANFGGKFVHFGKWVYANSNLTMVDDTTITVGDSTMLGPNVVLATGNHPLDPELRRQGYQFNLPIHIGSNVWLGAGVMVMPGVTIGDNTVVGAGSVVTRDLPANVLAMGTPCVVVRELGEQDKRFYHREREVPEHLRAD